MNNSFIREVIVLIISFTCVGVFVATAIASVLDLFNILKLQSDIRKKLHVVLLVEIIGISIAAYSGFMNPNNIVDQYATSQKENKESKTSLLLAKAEASGGANKAGKNVPDFKFIEKSVKEASSVTLNGSQVLWVDDNPENQNYERQALQQLGIKFILSKNTNEALAVLKKENIQVVITDFIRNDDPEGGYTLLEAVKKINPSIPLIIYSASANPEYIMEAKQRGAFGETNRPQELFNMVIDSIKQ